MSIDMEIASHARLRPITQIAESIGLSPQDIIPFGHFAAKVPLEHIHGAEEPGRLVLVTAMSPTPAGEGKTTLSIGLADAINEVAIQDNWRTVPGRHPAVLALREPSLGPVFGMKGGAAGGGWSQVLPMEDINLHFTGDFAAIALANNLACAMLDNHMHFGNALDIDPRRISIRRVVDINDRALRSVAIGLGGYNGGVPREDAFDIVVASEVMAIFCLATSLQDLKERIGRIVVARTRDRRPVTVDDLGAAGAMTALLRTALQPNLVQTIEHTPAFVHGGPFANIAHGCNSVLATMAARRFGQWAVTEAGFGADLGAEKFLDIKCRATGMWPDAAAVVATVRALKLHGGVPLEHVETEDLAALEAGMPNLLRHLDNLREIFGIPTVVGINRFPSDTDAEVSLLIDLLSAEGVTAVEANHWTQGGTGAVDLARAVMRAAGASVHDYSDDVEADVDVSGEGGGEVGGDVGVDGDIDGDISGDVHDVPAALADGSHGSSGRSWSRHQGRRFCYDLDLSVEEKIQAVVTRVYRGSGVDIPPAVRRKIALLVSEGHGRLPVCIAKTQYSFSTDPGLRGAPVGHHVEVRDIRLSAGAGFIVVICGDIMTMPGLPRTPSALQIDVEDDGRISGLF